MDKFRKKIQLSALFTCAVLICFTTLSAQNNSKRREMRAFVSAKGIYDDGLYQLAAEKFADFIQEFPESDNAAEAMFLRGEANFHQKYFDRAATYYQQMLRNYSAIALRDRAQYRIGQSLFYADRYSEAISALRTFLEIFPESKLIDQAHYWLGEALYNVGDFDNALQEYATVIGRFPQSSVHDYALYSAVWIYEQKQD